MGYKNKLDLREAITFDDVLIVPRHSDVEPSDVDLSTHLSKKIPLSTPFIGSPMPDVSGPRFCIAMAQQRAFSFLHRNYATPEEQAAAVEEVKTHEGYINKSPVTITPEMRISDILKLKEDYKLPFSSFPVVSKKNKLLGIITETDYYLERRNVLVKTRMTTNVATITLKEAEDRATVREILRREKKKRLLIVDKQGILQGLITGKDFVLREKYQNANRDSEGRLRVGGTVGVGKEELVRAELQYKNGVDSLIVDISHGDCKSGLDMVRKLKHEYGDDLSIGGGNVATAEGVEHLIDADADFARVNIGSGSICSTRVVLGAGVPQVTAIMECAEVAHASGIYVMADGGIKQYGDIAKALAAGADTVMMGNLFAGVEESPGRKVLKDGRLYKEYSGMASKKAILDRAGAGKSRYLVKDTKKVITQGVEGLVPYRGPLEDILFQMGGALQLSFGIVGARHIDDFHKRAILRKISTSGNIESHPSVKMTEQPDNYMQQ